MIVISEREVQRLLDMDALIQACRAAYQSVSSGSARTPVRHQIPLEPSESAALFMPGYLRDSDGLGVKMVTVVPENLNRGLPGTRAAFLLADVKTGEFLALIAATWLTMARTGAGTAVATELLAAPDAGTLGLIGAGTQAPGQIEAVVHVRPIERVNIYNRTRTRACQLATTVAKRLSTIGKPAEVRVVSTAEEAVNTAEIVVTATGSSEPVVQREWIGPGTHINAIGAFAPHMRELDLSILRDAERVFVDARDAASVPGELAIPVQQGVIQKEDIIEIGDVLLGQAPGRVSKGAITVFKSVGLAAQDIVAAKRVYQAARQKGLGTEVPF